MMQHRKLFLIITLLAGILLPAAMKAQRLSAGVSQELQKKEDTLKKFSRQIVFEEETAPRLRADSNFTRTLVRALKVKNSFSYPFDSVNVAKIYSPDSAFRIFTWQFKKDEYMYLQRGAIQMNTPDGSLRLFPLFDVSLFTRRSEDSVRSRKNWIGAIYYKIVLKEHNGKKYYTLLGFDEYTINSNKKRMEVLTFNEQGEPVFGGPYFSFGNDSAKKATQDRFSVEYKKEARVFFNYLPDQDLIVYDHLISESDEPEKKFTYIPDGDYEAFKWENGQWVHINNLEGVKLKDGDFPRESTIYDDAGKPDEQLLDDASRRNMGESVEPRAAKPPASKKTNSKTQKKKAD